MTFATTPLAIGPGIPVDARLPRIAPLSGTRMAAQGSFSDQLAAARVLDGRRGADVEDVAGIGQAVPVLVPHPAAEGPADAGADEAQDGARVHADVPADLDLADDRALRLLRGRRALLGLGRLRRLPGAEGQ